MTKWLDRQRNEVKPITVHNNAKHLRVFPEWMGNRELCNWEIHQQMEIPNVPGDEDVNKQVLRADHAENVLDYLGTYHCASTCHAPFYTMWHTGCRISGAIALDLPPVQSHLNPTERDVIFTANVSKRASGIAYRTGALVGMESLNRRPPETIPVEFVDRPFSKLDD